MASQEEKETAKPSEIETQRRGGGGGERIGTNNPLGGKKFGAKNLRQEKMSHLLFFKTGGNI